MSDLISTQESVAKIVDSAIQKILSGEQKLTKEYEQSVIDAVDEILNTARKERGKAEAQPEIIECKDCKFYTPMNRETKSGICGLTMHQNFGDNWFCAGAERRTDEGD